MSMKATVFVLFLGLSACLAHSIAAEQDGDEWTWLLKDRIKMRQLDRDGEVVYRFLIRDTMKSGDEAPEWAKFSSVNHSFVLRLTEMEAIAEVLQQKEPKETQIGDRWIEKLYLIKRDGFWEIEFRSVTPRLKPRENPMQREFPPERHWIKISDADLRIIVTLLKDVESYKREQ